MEFYQEKDENRLHSVVNWIVDIAVVIAFACYLVWLWRPDRGKRRLHEAGTGPATWF
ncbi:MAG: hypothetical protein ACLU8D_14165 [Enterocloster sp.]